MPPCHDARYSTTGSRWCGTGTSNRQAEKPPARTTKLLLKLPQRQPEWKRAETARDRQQKSRQMRCKTPEARPRNRYCTAGEMAMQVKNTIYCWNPGQLHLRCSPGVKMVKMPRRRGPHLSQPTGFAGTARPRIAPCSGTRCADRSASGQPASGHRQHYQMPCPH